MTSRKPSEKLSEDETQMRFEAALRGARIAGHKPKSAPKRNLGKVAKRTKAKKAKK
jgi:hypothetical protein